MSKVNKVKIIVGSSVELEAIIPHPFKIEMPLNVQEALCREFLKEDDFKLSFGYMDGFLVVLATKEFIFPASTLAVLEWNFAKHFNVGFHSLVEKELLDSMGKYFRLINYGQPTITCELL